MKKGKTIVEQLNNKGNVYMDVDYTFSPEEITNLLSNYVEVKRKDRNILICNYNGKDFAMYLKNITYLGNPHPKYKKRIQLGDNFKKKYNEYKKMGTPLLVIGVYKHDDVLLFVGFNTDKYKNNKSHNSSAHIFISDLQQAINKGYYKKIDYFSNEITSFTPDNLNKYLDSVLIKGDEFDDMFTEVDSFFKSVPKDWNGIECYQEMINADFNMKYQPEWPGFYLEYKFADYINKNKLNNVIEYEQNKTKGSIDLDLYFPRTSSYGDLKCHSVDAGAIPGNDYETITKLIKDSSVYYVVCEHETVKDSELGYATTKFWNESQHKDDLMSYHARMKGKVHITSYMILEINSYNSRYLSDFQKGMVNSNGKPRNNKIMISKKELKNFVVYRHDFN
ncbi:MAG: hypothetical protein PHH04_05920 [Thomasclavelia sp.]|nr:hypothetical protein [Thomasclavelia sp.]